MTRLPATKEERDLRSIWHRLVGPNPASDNIFDLGDDSSQAARLVVELKRCGYPITMPTLIEHPTMASLAPVLTRPPVHTDPGFGELWRSAKSRWDGTPAPALVPIALGTGTPFFFVHWGSGNITFLRRVADRFRHGRPVYGFESIGIRERRRPPMSVPELAELYLTELFRIQPNGPYLLGGICSGCDVAYEMALRITDRGHEVRFLALVYGHRPGLRQVDPGWGPADLYHLRLARMQILTGAHDLTTEMPRMMAVLKEIAYIDEDANATDFYWHTALWGALAFAQQHYGPRTYRGSALVFQSTRTAGTPGADWTPLAPNAEHIVVDLDDHIEMMATARFADAVRHNVLSRC
jgi:thioesterase domain-containing protein/aryl carrier-like protein